ncbi:MAG: hypothetical protein PHD92_02130 [Eubacteriales bacterium]|nr:hypothetical protein [Eubacteriales bacterium]
MPDLSYKEFMDEIRQRLKDFSLDDYKNLILHWAGEVLPAERRRFLGKLAPTANPRINHDLIDDVSAFARRVEKGDYCDGWGWDDDIHEERDWGDESWAGEMDDFFLQANYLLGKGYPHVARQVYESLFDILEIGQEPGHLPGDPDVTCMLQVNVHEQVALFLRSVYLTTDSEKRPDEIHTILMKFGNLYGPVSLQKIIEAREEALPDFDDFLAAWIELLLDQAPRTVSQLLREAVLLKGGIAAISEFARQYPGEHPEAYIDWIQGLDWEQDADLILQVSREGLSRIPADYSVRADVAEFIVRIGERNLDGELTLEGYRECFYARPSVSYLIDLYFNAIENNCFDEVRDQAERRVMELYSEGIAYRELYTYVPEGVVYMTLLFGGKYQQVYEMCVDQSSLGWSSGANPKPVFVAYMMMSLAKTSSPIVVNQLWDSTIMNLSSRLGGKDYEKCRKIMGYVREAVPLGRVQEEYYLDFIIDIIGQRVDAIVGGKYRNSYGKAATLLVAAVETLASRNEGQRGVELLDEFRQKYPRHSAFKRELANTLKLSHLQK